MMLTSLPSKRRSAISSSSLLLPLLLIGTTLCPQGIWATLYSEGGSYSTKGHAASQQPSTNSDALPDYFDQPQPQQEYQQPNIYRTESSPALEQERQRQRLATIVEQLRPEAADQVLDELAAEESAGADDTPMLNPDEPRQRNRNAEELEELRRLGMAIRQMSQQANGQQQFDLGESEQPEPVVEANADKKLAAVKKGQSEFVEFVEPSTNSRLKTVEWMEKRVPLDDNFGGGQRQGGGGPFRYFANSGNVLFIAYLAICCMGVVAGTVGGVYYYNHVRAARVDDPFNEFTRYSPTGPGKDKLKKNGHGPHGAFGQSGDDTLAYKAQLQHYQQQKQKILGAGPVVSGDAMSDNEEDADELEHNFSVFECPGLAPTGDVEIQNPNFVGDAEPKATKETEQKNRQE